MFIVDVLYLNVFHNDGNFYNKNRGLDLLGSE